MKKNPLLKFVLVRLALFAGILAAMLLLQFDPFFSSVVAAVLALSISLLFFSKQRNEASSAVYEWTQRRGDKDSVAEDASAEDSSAEETAVEGSTEGK